MWKNIIEDQCIALRFNPYRRLAIFFLVIGLGCRLALYLFNHPLYMDEAFVALNLADRDWAELTQQLDEFQVAPVLFLWAERAIYLTLGPSEWALRLLPFVASLLGLILFWRFVSQVVNAPAAAMATGLLAVSRWPLDLSSQVKPYSFDLLASIVLMSLAIQITRQPIRWHWLILSVLILPFALAASYPAAFVGTGLALVVLPSIWRQREWRCRLLYTCYIAILITGTLVCDVWLGARQLGPPGNPLHEFMKGYWTEDRAFPPNDARSVGIWLVTVHFGPLTGYPYGNGSAAGVITFPLMLLGVWVLFRRSKFRLLALLLIPFALTLAASLLGKYPYGGCTRVQQHLAPAVCILAAVGLTGLITIAKEMPFGATKRLLALQSPLWRYRAAIAMGGLFVGFALLLLGNWIANPYRDYHDVQAKHMSAVVMEHARAGDLVLYHALPESIRPGTAWYLRAQGIRFVPFAEPRWIDIRLADRPVWLVTQATNTDGERHPAGAHPPCIVDSVRTIEQRVSLDLMDTFQVDGRLSVELWRIRRTD